MRRNHEKLIGKLREFPSYSQEIWTTHNWQTFFLTEKLFSPFLYIVYTGILCTPGSNPEWPAPALGSCCLTKRATNMQVNWLYSSDLRMVHYDTGGVNIRPRSII